MNAPTAATDFALAQAEALGTKVRASAALLFGHEEPAGALEAVVRGLLEDARRLRERGGAGLPVIALVGRVGEGKSWLARAFLDPATATAERAEIASGQNDTERTHELVWFGPEKPFDLAASGERFLAVAAPRLLDLGGPYLVGDTPGFSDKDPRAWRLAGVAATSAPIKLLVTSLSQLRDGGTEHFVGTMNGALILPVVKFEPTGPGVTEPAASAQLEVLAELKKWRAHAPDSQILAPCFMPQQAVFGEAAAEELMRARLRAALEPVLAQPAMLRASVARQIEESVRRARGAIARLLAPFRQRAGAAVARLEELTRVLPGRVRGELLGEEAVLRAAIRQRLRADWLERTPALCFPFRTFAGVLALTHGAWDRLFFSALGSVPSLAVTLFKTVRNARDARRFATTLHSGLEERMQRLLAEEARVVLRDFEAALAALLPPAAASAPARAAQVRVHGLLDLETTAAGLLRAAAREERAASVTVWTLAVAGAGSFLWLLAGPVVSLYRTYLWAHDRALTADGSGWTDFPQPSGAMILASLLLSFAPAFFLALLAMTWCCLSARVRRIAAAFREALERDTTARIASGALAIELDEPRLEAARHLLALAGENAARD